MNQDMPFFSIIIPAYNVENYIQNTIDSIINQMFQDFELIIIDDCSSDNTLNIITSYEEKYNNIIIIKHSENQTQHIARMDGVNIAKGKYILFLDGDDTFTKDAFSILFDIIQNNQSYDFFEFGFIKQPSRKLVLPSFTGDDRFTAYFSKDKYPEHTIWNKVYDVNLLKKAFSIMEKVCIKQGVEDIYESIVIAYFIKKAMLIKKAIVNYTIGSGVSTTYKDYNKTIIFMNSLKIIFNLVNTFLRNNNLFISMDNIHYRHMSTAISHINSQRNIDEKKKLYLMLMDYFDSRIILEYFFDKENSFFKTKDYIVGHKILWPLRKIKSLLKYK
jgi:glycosyltransferase involved in cell wall biosynthesis